jgi:PAS domain S-box-containing protein
MKKKRAATKKPVAPRRPAQKRLGAGRSDRGRAQSDLGQSAERARILFEQAADSILMLEISPDGIAVIRDANSATFRILGYERSELIGQPVSFLDATPGESHTVRARRPDIRSGVAPTFEITHRCKDGTIRAFECSATEMKIGAKTFGISVERDITDRKRTERELQESRQLVEAIVENVPLMIFLKEAQDLRFVVFNRAGEELLGHDRKDLLGKNNLDLFPPEQAAFFEAKDREVLASDVLLDIPEEPILTAKKGQRWLHTRKLCIKGTDGVTKYLLGISEDITERKLVEEALRTSEERLRDVMFSAVDWVWEVDENGVYTYSSEKGCDLLGHSREEVIGKTPFDFMLPDEATRVAAAFSAIAQAKAPIKDLENWNIRANGEKVCFLTNGVPLLDAAGDLKGYRGVDKDITDRKRAETKLRHSEELYRSLFENMMNGFAHCQMLFDNGRPVDFIYLNVNRAFETQTGLKNVVGRKVSEVIPGIRERDPGLFELYARVATNGKPEVLETYVHALDMWFAISVYSPAREHFVVVFDVITDRKRAEDELREKTAFLEAQANSTIDGILIVDAQGRKVFQNRRTVDLWKIPQHIADDVDDKKQVAHVMHATRYPDQFVEQIAYLYDHPDETSHDEIELTDGTVLDRYSAPVLGKGGHHYGRIWSFRDITARKRAEERIAVQLEELKRWHDVMLDREDRVQELKREVNDLCGRVRETARYPSQQDSPDDSAPAKRRP